MPTFDAYKETARSRGSLAFEVFVVTSRPAAPMEEVAAHLPDHLAYLTGEEAAGRLMMAGPLSDEAGVEMSGIGFQVWRAESWAEAQALAAADPMHVAGVKTFEMRRWLINEGTLSLTVGLSSGRLALR
ncbi:MAG: YciI family protein [Pseudomonadota bacterium]